MDPIVEAAFSRSLPCDATPSTGSGLLGIDLIVFTVIWFISGVPGTRKWLNLFDVKERRQIDGTIENLEG